MNTDIKPISLSGASFPASQGQVTANSNSIPVESSGSSGTSSIAPAAGGMPENATGGSISVAA